MDIAGKLRKVYAYGLEGYYYRTGKARYFLKDKLRQDIISELDRLSADVEKYDVISFDVLDTCLLRTVDHFRHARQVNAAEYEKRFGKERSGYHRYWRSAYKQAINNLKPGEEETNVYEIYREFVKLSGADVKDVDRLVEMERDVELDLCFRNPYIYPIYQLVKKLDKKVLFISDMYLTGDIIHAMLEKCGYEKDTLYVGSEVRKTKYSGNLFDHVLEKENIDPSRMLHIGDNIKSDIKKARSRGINTFYFRKHDLEVCKFDYERNFFEKKELSLNDSLTLGLVRKNHLLNPSGLREDEKTLYDIGYEVVGPTQLSYLLWILNRAEKHKLGKLFFLARDGYYLEKSFLKIREKFNLDIEGQYLFSSRKLYYLPRHYKLDPEALEFYSTAHQKLKAKDFLIRLGIDPSSHLPAFRKAGIQDPDLIVTNETGQFLNEDAKNRIINLIREMKAVIEEIAHHEHNKFIDYVTEMGVNRKDAALIDVGWNATSLYYTNSILESKKLDIPMGFYFGTWSSARKCVNKGYPIESYFMRFDQPRFRRNIVRGNIAILELFFTAPHPTIIGLNKNGNNWEAVYEPENTDQAGETIIEYIYKGVEQYVDDLINKPGFSLEHDIRYIELVLRKLLIRPGYRVARVIGRHRHKISFGSVTQMVPIAPEPPDNLSRSEKRKFMKESHWKNGTRSLLRGRK